MHMGTDEGRLPFKIYKNIINRQKGKVKETLNHGLSWCARCKVSGQAVGFILGKWLE
jgi:hypothetical protein